MVKMLSDIGEKGNRLDAIVSKAFSCPTLTATIISEASVRIFNGLYIGMMLQVYIEFILEEA